MPLTMTYDQWMKDTYSYVRPRSDSLKLIDNAVKARNEDAAKKALVNWINEQNRKKQDWQRSVRNEKGAVKKLYDQLSVLGDALHFNNLDDFLADSEAKAFIKLEQQLAASRMFAGKNLKFKDSFWGITRTKCKDQRSKLDRLINAGKNGVGVGSKVVLNGGQMAKTAMDLKMVIQTIMGASLPPSVQTQILETVLGSTIENFVTSATPLLGTISSGGQAIKAWISVALSVRAADQMKERRGDIRLGDPSAALLAILTIIDKEIRIQKAEGAIRTTAFTAKGLLTLADMGTVSTTAVGAVESIAIMLNTLVDVVEDALQIHAGNKLILANKIDLNLFSACPILGCYYIVVQDHSTIMNFDIENMGKENWRQEAERLKYAIKPVIKKGAELIEKSRVEMQGMEMAKGVYQSTFKQKINSWYKSKGYGQDKKSEFIEGIFKN